VRGGETNGILANPFLEHAFKTLSYSISVTMHDDGSWSYELVTVLERARPGRALRHTDRNTLRKIGEPTPNPTARAALAQLVAASTSA
jgi:hypothetical protein